MGFILAALVALQFNVYAEISSPNFSSPQPFHKLTETTKTQVYREFLVVCSTDKTSFGLHSNPVLAKSSDDLNDYLTSPEFQKYCKDVKLSGETFSITDNKAGLGDDVPEFNKNLQPVFGTYKNQNDCFSFYDIETLTIELYKTKTK